MVNRWWVDGGWMVNGGRMGGCFTIHPASVGLFVDAWWVVGGRMVA